MKVVGIEKRMGTFEGKAWEHYLLHCQKEQKEGMYGTCTQSIKVKLAPLQQYMDDNKLTFVKDLIGKDINFYYDQYRNVSALVG